MTKITVEPTRLIAMLKQSIGCSSGKNPIKDQSLIVFTPKGASVGYSLAADAIVCAQYEAPYFKSIEVPEDKQFEADFEQLKGVITTATEPNVMKDAIIAFIAKYPKDTHMYIPTLSLAKDRLGCGFKSEVVTLTTDTENVMVVGKDEGDDTISEKLNEVTPDILEAYAPFEIKMFDIGLLPARVAVPYSLQALIPAEKITDLPTLDEIEFDTDGKTLKVHIKDQLGKRDRPIPIKQYAKDNTPNPAGTGTAIQVKFNMKLVQQLIAIFEGDVWISLCSGSLILSQKYADYALSYIIAAKEA